MSLAVNKIKTEFFSPTCIKNRIKPRTRSRKNSFIKTSFLFFLARSRRALQKFCRLPALVLVCFSLLVPVRFPGFTESFSGGKHNLEAHYTLVGWRRRRHSAIPCNYFIRLGISSCKTKRTPSPHRHSSHFCSHFAETFKVALKWQAALRVSFMQFLQLQSARFKVTLRSSYFSLLF